MSRGQLGLRLKRVYEDPSPADGFRILVDRLWPRGISREKARVALWLKDVAPSHDLRTWFAHDPGKWPAFVKKYSEELEAKGDLASVIREKAAGGTVTLLYAAADAEHNNAAALKAYLETDRPSPKKVRPPA